MAKNRRILTGKKNIVIDHEKVDPLKLQDFKLANGLFSEHRYEEAINILNRLYDPANDTSNPFFFSIANRLGAAYYEIGNYQKTIEIFQKLYEKHKDFAKNPHSFMTAMLLSQAYRECRRHKESKKILLEIAELDKKSQVLNKDQQLTLYRKLSNINLADGNFHESKDWATKILQIDNNNYEANTNLGTSFMQLAMKTKNEKERAKYYENANLYLEKAIDFGFRQKQSQEDQMNLLKVAVENFLSQQNPEKALNLALIFYKKREYKEIPELYILISGIYNGMENYEEASRYLEECVKKFPVQNNLAVINLIIGCKLKLGKIEEAEGYKKLLMQCDIKTVDDQRLKVDALRSIAIFYYENKKYQKCLQTLENDYKQDQELALMSSIVLIELQEYREAEIRLNSLLETPDLDQFYRKMALRDLLRVYYHLGNPEMYSQASNKLKELGDERGDDQQAGLALIYLSRYKEHPNDADLRMFNGHINEGIKLLSQQDESELGVCNRLGFLYLVKCQLIPDQESAEKAVALLHKAIELHPDDQLGTYLNLCFAYLVLIKYDPRRETDLNKALETLERVKSSFPEHEQRNTSGQMATLQGIVRKLEKGDKTTDCSKEISNWIFSYCAREAQREDEDPDLNVLFDKDREVRKTATPEWNDPSLRQIHIGKTAASEQTNPYGWINRVSVSVKKLPDQVLNRFQLILDSGHVVSSQGARGIVYQRGHLKIKDPSGDHRLFADRVCRITRPPEEKGPEKKDVWIFDRVKTHTGGGQCK